MNKSINNSDVDIDINSIINCKPSPSSPFLAVSPFFSGQYLFSRQQSAQKDSKKIYDKLFQFPDFGTNPDFRRLLEQPRADRPNLPAYQNWRVPLADSREADEEWVSGLNDQNFKVFQQPVQNKGPGFENVHLSDKNGSTGISTKSMVMLNPRTQRQSGNFQLKDSIEDYDEQKYELTTFYLKRFNMFSNSSKYASTVEDIASEVSKPEPYIKKLNKPITKPQINKIKQKTHEKRSKRKITCNCKNSSCIKMYCECFRENGYCNKNCKCKDCKNFQNSTDRNLNLQNISKRQADEFAFKLSKEEMKNQPYSSKKSCRCKKSQCQKKYCECYNDGAFCNAECCCTDCLNSDSR